MLRDFRIYYQSNRLVDTSARPAVQGLLKVGEAAILIVTTDGFCGLTPSVNWAVTNPSVARVAGELRAQVTGTSPGHTDVVATVRFRGRVSEARLSWCQSPAGHNPLQSIPFSECTWIPMEGIKVVQ